MTAGPRSRTPSSRSASRGSTRSSRRRWCELVDGLVARSRAGVGRLPRSAGSVPRGGSRTGTRTSRRWSSAVGPPGEPPRRAAAAAATACSWSTSAIASTNLRTVRSRSCRTRPRSACTTTATSWRRSGPALEDVCGTFAPGRVVLATGAHERFVAFAGNDRPGVMLASAAATYVERFGVLPGNARRSSPRTMRASGRRCRSGRAAPTWSDDRWRSGESPAERRGPLNASSSGADGNDGRRSAARLRRLEPEPRPVAIDRRRPPLRRAASVRPERRRSAVARGGRVRRPVTGSPGPRPSGSIAPETTRRISSTCSATRRSPTSPRRSAPVSSRSST